MPRELRATSLECFDKLGVEGISTAIARPRPEKYDIVDVVDKLLLSRSAVGSSTQETSIHRHNEAYRVCEKRQCGKHFVP